MSTVFDLGGLRSERSGRWRLDTASGSTSPAGDLSGGASLSLRAGQDPGQIRSSTGREVLYAKRLGFGDSVQETVTLTAQETPRAPAVPATQEQVAEQIAAALEDFEPGGTSVAISDEGTPLGGTATILDFVGSGVTATGAGGTKTITIAGGQGQPAALPSNIDMSWKPLTSGTGTVTQARDSNYGGSTRILYTAGNRAAIVSGPLGWFDFSTIIAVASTTGSPGILWIAAPDDVFGGTRKGISGPAQTWAMAVVVSGSSLIFYYVSSATTVTLATVTGYGSSVLMRVQRDAGGYTFTSTKADASLSVLRVRTNQLSAYKQTGPVRLVLGGWDASSNAMDITFSATELTRTPKRSMSFLANGLGGEPPRGATEFDDAILCGEVTRIFDILRYEPTGSLTGPSFAPGSKTYGNNDYQFGHVWWNTWLRDLGGTDTARRSLNNFLVNAEAVTNRIGNIVTTTGIKDNNGAGRPWVQGYIAQMAYQLAHDGDLTWLQGGSSTGYTTIKNSLLYIETARKTARGVFKVDSSDEMGWDGNVGLDPLVFGPGSGSSGSLRYESVILSSNMYLEYRAMQAIATMLGNTSDATTWGTKAATLKTDIQTNLWNSSANWLQNYDTTGVAFVNRYSADIVHALFAGVLSAEQAALVRARLIDPAHFLRPYGITSLDITDGSYIGGSGNSPSWTTNWNGGVWEPVQYQAAFGLMRYGYYSDALEVARRASEVYRVNYTDATTNFGTPGEWNLPETGIAKAQSSPFLGWGIGARLWGEIKMGYDPSLIDPTTTLRPLGTYSRVPS